MADDEDLHSLSQLLDRIAGAGSGDRISVRDLLGAVGQRSYGPLLLMPGILLVSPLSSIPGLPSVGGIVVAVIAAHLMLGRERIWLPGFILRRRVGRDRMDRAIRFLRPIARVADRLIRPRVTFLTRGAFTRIIGGGCFVVALMMPPLEVLPMANTMTAAAVSIFALALVAHDGVLAIVAILVMIGILYLGIDFLLL